MEVRGFDSLDHPRKGLLIVFEQIVDSILARRREKELGIMNLFGDVPADDGGPVHDERVPIPDDEFDKSQRLAFEKEMLGLYVSDHPLMGVEGALARHTDCSINGLRGNKALIDYAATKGAVHAFTYSINERLVMPWFESLPPRAE